MLKLFEQIDNTVINNKLIDKDDRVLIGFSGGTDSVFMTQYLLSKRKEYNITLLLVYVNHNIRKDSKDDIEFVKRYAILNNVDMRIIDLDIPEIAKTCKMGLEQTGRIERYKTFEDISKKEN